MKHLAIFVGDAVEKILDGRKTVECRFSLKRMIPFGKVHKNDEILLKQSGGQILGRVMVKKIISMENLDKEDFLRMQKGLFQEVCMTKKFWKSKEKSKFATFIFLKSPERFITPINMPKKDRRGWVVLDKTSFV